MSFTNSVLGRNLSRAATAASRASPACLGLAVIAMLGIREWADSAGIDSRSFGGRFSAAIAAAMLLLAWHARRADYRGEALFTVQRKLSQRDTAYRALFRNIPAAVFVCDRQGVIQKYNKRAVEMWGHSPAIGEDTYRGAIRLRLPDGTPLPTDKDPLNQVLLTGDSVRGVELQLEQPQGHTIPIITNFAALFDSTGSVCGAVIVFDDIFGQKQVELELIKAREVAEHASQAKGAFLANMSHEIRTPMAAILGHADLMLDPNLTPSGYQNGLQSIRRNGEHLLNLINEILDLSKIEAGKMKVERIPIDLPRLAFEAISNARPKAILKGLTLSLEFATPIPATGLTDPLRLRQILVNLIGNAIKFTETGAVRLRVSCPGPSETDAVLRFDIIDTGIGLTEAEHRRLFQTFSQADTSTTRRFGGTGLGLAISRQLARLLGGDISVVSSPGVGSTFTVEVGVGPIVAGDLMMPSSEAGRSEEHKITASIPRDLLRDIRILLAEDGLDNREIISAYLHAAGAAVTVVDNGREAIEEVGLATREGRPYSIVLMDMQMPVLDGYGATSELRLSGYKGPIIALTAHAMADDRTKCLNSGCTDYLSKPVQRLDLVSLIVRCLAEEDAAIDQSPLATLSLPAPSAGEADSSDDSLFADAASAAKRSTRWPRRNAA